MIIKSIKIDGFGKHKDLNLIFSEGLNVVYGSNEVGKSTLQAFIKAMFYGLNSRTRNIADNPRKKYTPWDADVMGGEIRFLHNGLEYCLARKFGEIKSKDKILLSLAATGEMIPISAKTEPGEYLFNITQATFESTLFVGQLDSKIDASTAKESEILTKLSNLAGTGDENTDINFIENNLKKPMLYLHAARGQSGFIDKKKARLGELKEELAAFQEAKNTSLKIIHDLNVYTARRESILEDIQRHKRQLRATVSHHSVSEFTNIRQIKEQRTQQKQALEEVQQQLLFGEIQVDRLYYEECVEEFRTVEAAIDELTVPGQMLQNAKEMVSSIDDKLATMEYINHFNVESFEELHSFKNELSRSIERKKSLDLQLTDAMIEAENKKALCDRTPKFIISALLFLVAAVMLIITGGLLFSTNRMISFILFGLSAIVLITTVLFWTIHNRKRTANKLEYTASKTSLEHLNEQLEAIQQDLSAYIANRSESTQRKIAEVLGKEDITANTLEQKYTILSKYIGDTLTALDCVSLEEIREKLSVYKTYKQQREDAMAKVLALTEEFTAKERISCDTTAKFYDKYAPIFSFASIEGIQETLQEIFRNLNKYDTLVTDLKYSGDYLRNALGGRSYEDLEAEANLASGEDRELDSQLPTEPGIIEKCLEELDKDLNTIKDAISDTNVRIAANFKSMREENEILADIQELSESIEQLEYQYTCIKLARNMVKESFDEIQQSFGPKLNDRASDILNTIKPDNPMAIKVNREFQISLSPKNSILPYEIDYFSYGAQDQAYFALRMAISDILSADFEGFPLLLDDPFVQYDETRMHGALDFLSDVAGSRQVFIFTCHKNVAEYSNRLGGNCFELGTLVH